MLLMSYRSNILIKKNQQPKKEMMHEQFNLSLLFNV